MKQKRMTIKAFLLVMILALLVGNVHVVQAAVLEDALGMHDIVIDNSSSGATIQGAWDTTSTATNPERSIGSDYRTVKPADHNGQFLQYNTPASFQQGRYKVYVSTYRSQSNRSTNVPIDIFHLNDASATTLSSVTVSQKGSTGAVWIPIGEFEFQKGDGNYIQIKVDGAEGYVLADAVRFQPMFTPAPPILSSDATLSSLQVNPGLLDFNPQVTDYHLDVLGNVYSTIDVTPTVTSTVYKSLQINGQESVSGSTYTVQLMHGSNTIAIVVTAQDNTTLTYYLQVNRISLSDEASLSSLTLDRGTLNFSPDVTNYQVQVGDEVNSLGVTPVVLSTVYKSLTINGHSQSSGETYQMPLLTGSNMISIQVTAQDGTEKLYTVHVIKQGNVATLSSLSLTRGSLNFSPWRTVYSIYVGNKVDTFALTPASTSGFFDHMTVNGIPHVSGTPYNIELQVGDNAVVIEVTSKDQRQMTYTVNVSRLDATANAQMVNGAVTLPAGKLAESLGVHLHHDTSGLLVYSERPFEFADPALQEELTQLLNLRLKVDGEHVAFFNPKQTEYRLLLPADGHLPLIDLESGAETRFTVKQAANLNETAVLTIESVGIYTFTFVQDTNAQTAPPSLAGIKVTIEGKEEVAFVPTWIPVAYVDANDGYANVNTPNKTVDNDLNTRWSATSQGEVKWIRYDLGSKVNVHSMSVAGYLGNERSYNFEVEISDDGVNWQQLLPMQSTSGTILYPEMFLLGDVQTRYVRLPSYGYGPTRDGWNGFSEVRFYTSQEQANLDASKWDEYFAPSSNKLGDQLKLSVKGLTSEGVEHNLNPVTTSIAFYTDNAAIAEVDQAGNVLLTGVGEARITVMATQGDAVRLGSLIISVSN
ncbi:cadherin-like beta sandwich domain-containing protein [Paenibacillus qinlingensis]|uniref:cadherin-like beta sandwich domain-containing protein n=1 Tax=Paenibacillus qinlingensis TaxID=1837343 RepID=UPI0015633C27|nr:cadherin-like beta sandwich domain-containing protein [Paenibacillus qinlingensis]NQX60823.1 cadherin-like beta sandwich domain-containing protein [Paenibacillus qinlingensis]